MTGYTKTKTFTTGETINAGDFTTEFNNVSVAFDESTGHTHNGDADSGARVPLISSPAGFTKITTTEATDQLNFYTNVSSAAALQFSVKDGVIEPNADSDVDIGTTAKRFKDLYIDSATVTGTVTTNQVDVAGQVLLSDTSTIKFGTDGSNYFEIYKATGVNGGSFIKEVGGGAITLQGQNGYLRSDTKAVASWGSLDIALKYNDANRIVTTDAGIDVTGAITVSSDGSADLDPDFNFVNTESGANGNTLGQMIFTGNNSNGDAESFAYITGKSTDVTDGEEDGEINLVVRKAGTHTRILHASQAGIDVTGTVTADGLSLGDNKKAFFGAGNDLQIYHDGSNSYITDSGTGNLLILANDFRIRNAAGNEDMLQVNQDGDVKVSYDGVTKLATTATGIDVTGTVAASDGLTADYIDLTGGESTTTTGTIACKMIVLDDASSDQSDASTIFTEGTGLTSSLVISQADDVADKIKLRVGSAGTLVDALTASIDGINVTGTVTADDQIIITSNDSQVAAQPTLTLRSNEAASTDNQLGEITFQGHNNQQADATYAYMRAESPVITDNQEEGKLKFFIRKTGNAYVNTLTADSSGIDVTGIIDCDGLKMDDGEYAQFGTGNDLQIFHSGVHSYIKDRGTGVLSIQTDGDSITLHDSANARDMAKFSVGGTASLSWAGGTNAGTKLSTTQTGIDVTGTIECDTHLQIQSTGSGADAMPDLYMTNMETAANAQNLGMIHFRGYNDASTPTIESYANIYAQQVDVSDGAEEGKVVLQARDGAGYVNALVATKDGITVGGQISLPSSGTDSCFIGTTVTDSATHLDFRLKDDDADSFRFRFDHHEDGVAGYVNAARIRPDSDIAGSNKYILDVTGKVVAEGFSGTGGSANVITHFSTDGAFSSSTNSLVPTALAVKTYVDAQAAAASDADITSVVAGTGLTGGAVAGDATLNVIGGVGIVANANDIAIDLSELTDMTADVTGTTEVILNNGGTDSRKAISEIKLSAFNNDSSFSSTVGTVTAVSVGTGLDVSNASTTPGISLDFTELTDMTADVAGTTEIILNNANTESRKAISEIKLSAFNNDLTFANTDTTYTAGTGLSLSAGNQFSVNAAQTQITSVGTLGSLNVTGDVTLNGSYPTGTSNTFIGAATRTALTSTGNQNVGIGSIALQALTTGDNNVAVGSSSLPVLTTGSSNIAVGKSAASLLETGSDNIAIGGGSLFNAASISNTIAIGDSALYSITSGSSNLGLGKSAGFRLSAGADNTFIGNSAGYNTHDSNYIVAIGSDAGRGAAPESDETVNYTGGDDCIAIGKTSQYNTTTGTKNVTVGTGTGKNITTGNTNTFIGNDAGEETTTGIGNVSLGHQALNINTIGTGNVALGAYASGQYTASYRTCIGKSAGQWSSGSNTTLIGRNAGIGTVSATASGAYTVAVGANSLRALTTGANNVGLGASSGNSVSEGDNNTLIGYEAGENINTGSNNIVIGAGSGSGLTLGNNVTIIGSATGLVPNLNSVAYSGAVAISSNDPSYPTPLILMEKDGEVHIPANNGVWSSANGGFKFENVADTKILKWARGSTSSTNAYAQLFYNSTGSIIGSINSTSTGISISYTSDYRLKENVSPLTGSIDRLKALKPCTFNFLSEPTRQEEGFIAHEVQEVVPQAVVGDKDAVDENGDVELQGVDPSRIVVILTGALQEAVEKIEQLEERISALES